MKQRIAYPDNPVMAAAFINFVAWAGGRPDILDWYHNATGRMPFWAKPRSAIDEKCARYPIHYPLPYPQFCGEYKPKDKSDEI